MYAGKMFVVLFWVYIPTEQGEKYAWQVRN